MIVLYLMHSVVSSPWTERKIAVIRQDLARAKTVCNLLEAGYLRLGEVVVKRIAVIKFGVNVGGDDGTGCVRSHHSDSSLLLQMAQRVCMSVCLSV